MSIELQNLIEQLKGVTNSRTATPVVLAIASEINQLERPDLLDGCLPPPSPEEGRLPRSKHDDHIKTHKDLLEVHEVLKTATEEGWGEPKVFEACEKFERRIIAERIPKDFQLAFQGLGNGLLSNLIVDPTAPTTKKTQ